MKELSLNILDIAQNSISANADLIYITVHENISENYLKIIISDNGKGMSKEFLKTVTDPFSTTRKTRKVGMGISLLKLVTEQTDGAFSIQSEIGVGTVVTAEFTLNHIDRPPLGDIEQTISTLISCNEHIDFVFTRKVNKNEFVLDTREIKKILNGVSLSEPDIIIWIQEYIKENENNLLEE
ncbi:MAG: ATP-binding protein [Clostridia bacterium]|nr:ATP-binding protein [Clostridia bacterium]